MPTRFSAGEVLEDTVTDAVSSTVGAIETGPPVPRSAPQFPRLSACRIQCGWGKRIFGLHLAWASNADLPVCSVQAELPRA